MNSADANNDPFFEVVHDILSDPVYNRLDQINHHGNSILDHSLKVARISWKIGGFLGLDQVSIVRGAMLHDFFLYDWNKGGSGISRKAHQFWKRHGYTHPRAALHNATSRFTLNKKEQNIILRHMFPLTPIPPCYAEAWVVTLCDKIIATMEIPHYIGHFFHKKQDHC